MSEWKQPWRPLKLGGRRARLQILDPATAFEWEPILVEILGETLSFAISSPDQILTNVITRAAPDQVAGRDLRSVMLDPEHGPEMATAAIRTFGAIAADVISHLQFSPDVAKRVFHAFVYGRLVVDGIEVEDGETWVSAGLTPMCKWVVLGAQIRNTYGPLWTRAPYSVRSESKTYGVKAPSGVPLAVRWADNLAHNNSARSSHEILTEWTPVRMIEVVENNAYRAEIERRAYDAARAGSR